MGVDETWSYCALHISTSEDSLMNLFEDSTRAFSGPRDNFGKMCFLTMLVTNIDHDRIPA